MPLIRVGGNDPFSARVRVVRLPPCVRVPTQNTTSGRPRARAILTPRARACPRRNVGCRCPWSSSSHQDQHQSPLKDTAPSGGDGAAPQACSTNFPLHAPYCHRTAVVVSTMSFQPTKLLRARCAATDASHVLTQAKRLPASQRTAPCTQ